MGTAGAAESATVGTPLRGHWYDAVLALLDESDQAEMHPELVEGAALSPSKERASTGSAHTSLAELGRGHELAAVARRVLDQVPA